ncbi:stalk domain-containing protein [Ureibacillus sp. MALMAid1270]|uniref:stalk domain-containing protein n=1 Tax=Ureibacillus sp. MALMAid1270 TaxID=3411629 RepID=UPI003BA51FB3
MKKIQQIIPFFMVFFIILVFYPFTTAQAVYASVYVDGELVDYDVEPRIESNRTLVPIRKTAEMLGYKVVWDQKTKTVNLYNGSNNMILYVDKLDYTLNGKKLKTDVKTKVYNGRTLIPLRMVVDFFDQKIQWDQKTRSVLISTTGEVVYPQELIKVPVLMYHHFDEKTQNSVTVDPKNFEEQMLALQKAGYETITTEQMNAFLNGKGKLPNKPVLITMDDGYESNYIYAYETLKKYNMKATIFLITSQVCVILSKAYQNYLGNKLLKCLTLA